MKSNPIQLEFTGYFINSVINVLYLEYEIDEENKPIDIRFVITHAEVERINGLEQFNILGMNTKDIEIQDHAQIAACWDHGVNTQDCMEVMFGRLPEFRVLGATKAIFK